jgi:hypothetical protein
VRRPQACLLAVALLVAPAAAWADDAIAVMVERADDPVAVRMRAELEALGFRVIILPVSERPPSREALEAAAREAGAVAAVRVVPSQKGVEVWVTDRATGKTVLREVVSPQPGSPAGSGTIAVRAVELLRASLMEVESATPPPGEVPITPMVRAAALPRAPSDEARAPPPSRRLGLSVQLGPAVAIAAGGVDPTVHMLVDLRWVPGEWLGVDVCGLVPTAPARIESKEGSSLVTLALLGAGAHIALAPLLGDHSPEPRWTPTLGAGVAAAWLQLEGVPKPPYAGRRGAVGMVAPYLRAGLGVTALPHLRLRLDLIGGATAPRPVIRHAANQTAAWGPIFGVGSAGAEVAW